MDIQKGPNIDIVVSDIYNWIEIEDNSFDVVVSGQAFEHMEFFWKAIKEIERILKPGGLCCIIAPSAGQMCIRDRPETPTTQCPNLYMEMLKK